MKTILEINGKQFEVTGRRCGSVRMIEPNGRSPKLNWSKSDGLICPRMLHGFAWPLWIQPYVLPLSEALRKEGA